MHQQIVSFPSRKHALMDLCDFPRFAEEPRVTPRKDPGRGYRLQGDFRGVIRDAAEASARPTRPARIETNVEDSLRDIENLSEDAGPLERSTYLSPWA